MPITFTWHGHSSIALDIDGCHVLVDPFFSGNPATKGSAERVEADFILVSHGHGDHVGDAVAIAKRTGATVVSNFEIVNWLTAQGVARTHAQHLGGGHAYPFGHVKLTFALHGSALPDGSYGGNPAGFVVKAAGKTIYLAGDTGLFGDMRLIGEEGLDLAAIPIGDNFTMGPDDALRAVRLLAPKLVVPIHYSTWELLAQDAGAWAARVERETTTRVRVLAPGESFEL